MPSGVHPQVLARLAAGGASVEGVHPAVVISEPEMPCPCNSRNTPRERRSVRQYDLRLDCQLYRIAGRYKADRAGAGKTTVWGRRSVLIQTDAPLSKGECVQVVSDWMFGIQLVVRGRVIRHDERGVALKIRRPRFQGKAADFWDREVKAFAAERICSSDLDLTHRA